MHRTERLAVYATCTAALVLSIRAASVDSTARAAVPAPALVEPATRIATLDTLAVTEALFSSDAFAPARQSEEDRLKSRLTPLETELDSLQNELKGADPGNQEAQAKARVFEEKRDQYFKLRQELSDSYDKIVSGQFADAFERVQGAARVVAGENNYTHVLSHKPGRPTGQDPQRLIADLLGRPVLVSPDTTDITALVLAQLKIAPGVLSEPRR